jgi:hypothetical protein
MHYHILLVFAGVVLFAGLALLVLLDRRRLKRRLEREQFKASARRATAQG